MKHKHKRQPSPRTILSSLLMVLAAVAATLPFIFTVGNLHMQSAVTSQHDEAAAQVRDPKRGKVLKAAREYNKRLYASGQRVMGDAVDPFESNGSSASGKSSKQETLADEDKDYQSQLSTPSDGIMGTIRYPRLGIELPIRHGTSADVLAAGAGHMYGTSIPVGGKNTHAVISAHTGLGDRMMFDKLSLRQGKVGDFFYITVLGKDLAYQVTSITVVNPDEFDKLKIVEGEDLVTLLTCTPYGVNNRRLLVTGKHVATPSPAPNLRDAPKDPTVYYLIALVVAVWIAAILYVIWRQRRGSGSARSTRSADSSDSSGSRRPGRFHRSHPRK